MTDDRSGEGGFLSRWSRRKAQTQTAAPAKPPAQTQGEANGQTSIQLPPQMPGTHAAMANPAENRQAFAPASPTFDSAQGRQSTPQPSRPQGTDGAAAPRPTLEDVEQLDSGSDYRAFVARDVDPEVRNAAFKKLFHSDPHFNVMDGLDVYIDDYNTPNPLPVAIMKTLVQARALGLIDDELKEQDRPSIDEGGHAQASPPPDAQQDAVPQVDGPDAVSQGTPSPDTEPALVELKMVSDTASNDEHLVRPTGPSAHAMEPSGNVVPLAQKKGFDEIG